MSLVLHPDPQQPTGGYGFLELPGSSLPDMVTLAVQDAYSERWLTPVDEARVEIGNPNWQPQRASFGPYQVLRHDGADWVRIGPEIVNKLEEYTPLVIEVDGRAFNVTWPDTIPPRAGLAGLGGLQTVQAKPAPAPEPEVKRPPEPDPVVEPDQNIETEPRKRSLLWLWIILLLLIAAGAAAWFWTREESVSLPINTTPVSNNESCGLPALSALPGFATQLEALRTCGRDVSPDTALKLIEDAAQTEDPLALRVFGTLYDGDQLDPRIENLIGLSFADDPARAVEYYARAVEAGDTQATSHVTTNCDRLKGSSQTLEKGAYDDFCR
ncbi:hypothetical protein [Falsiruegeria mediterranea]|uniref:Uncharacterized protein n=1 Tax=Falsiruegeria mediterranea M17 TaxID=1200281 RepID=A0A2R8CFC9_9RHOB|nr:hypothetical protein [Falsiruegeria mediterranea]SPJ31120.1 hypothetical protein TRM7615_04660 [Falsiruegeria mediterranea M17]